MPLLPSIYDLNADALGAHDFSRPLFVQASRPDHFAEVLDVVHHRLALSRRLSTVLTTAAFPARPGDAARHVVRNDARLSQDTRTLAPQLEWDDYSVIALTTTAGFGDHYGAMRHQGNLACFCHSLEPMPTILINGEGQLTTALQLFEVVERAVGEMTLTGNIQISEHETAALYRAAVARLDGQVVEVGRFSGGTAMVLAAAGRASGRPGLTSVDIERLPAADYFFALNGLTDDITLWHGDSAALGAEWPQRAADPGIAFLFIDADHSYDAVVRDLAAWTPHLIDGGTLILHDLGSPDCGVSKAVYYFIANRPEYRNLRQVGSMLFCERTRVAA